MTARPGRRRPSTKRRPARMPGVRPSRFTIRDLFTEALAGILQRPARALLTSLGTLLGVGAFVAVLGLTATATNQISSRFNALTATEVTVEDAGTLDPALFPNPFPADADKRLAQVNGVVAGGVYWTVPAEGHAVRAAPVGADAAAQDVRVVAASPGLFGAIDPTMSTGRTFDEFHNAAHARVAVLGAGIAARLGISDLGRRPAIFIGDVPYSVVGVISSTRRLPDLLLSVMIPISSVDAIGAQPEADALPKMLVATRLGAADQVARELPLALRPDRPDALRAIPPPDPRTLRDAVHNDLGALFLTLAGVSLVIGTVGIANTTFVAVLERVQEIGLRRSLGARGTHIASQFLTESAMLGVLGGLFGCSAGVVTVVAVAAVHRQTPVLAPAIVLLAPLIGLGTGLLAGGWPALRAAKIEPVEALRR